MTTNTFHVLNPLQKAIKEKEFELITIKNQKLENLCRALQGERKSLFEKVQGAGSQPDINTTEPTEKEDPVEVPETPEVPKDNNPVQNTAASASAATETPKPETPKPETPKPETPKPETLLTKELAKVKAEQALLKEIASSFTISHVVPTETVVSQSQGLSEGVQEPEENHREESNLQEVLEDGCQEQRDLEMESVD